MEVTIDLKIKKLNNGCYQGIISLIDKENVTVNNYETDPDYTEYKECLYDTKRILDSMIDEVTTDED